MATNWNVKQAYTAIANGEKENIIDIGRRFPLTLNILAKIRNDNPAVDLINALPEHITVRKIEQFLKEGVTEEVESDNTTEEVNETATQKESKTADGDYEGMNRKQLRELIISAGGEKKCREEFGWAKREQLIGYIEKYGVDPVADEEEKDDPYAGKTAVELFKECKKRGIKAAPKKTTKFYIDLLKKADSEAEKEEEAEDDWDDEEEEEKPVEKKPKKTAKAAPKKVEVEDDDDEDDWDI